MQISRILTSTCLLLGYTIALIPSVTIAQSLGGGGDQRDPFGRASSGDTSGLMQLINESQLSGKTPAPTAETQRDRLDSATQDFRARQLQVLRQQRAKKNAVTKPVLP